MCNRVGDGEHCVTGWEMGDTNLENILGGWQT